MSPMTPLSPVHYLVDEATGCWIWQRTRNHRGYGQIGVDGKVRMAHRHYYEKHRGPIPAGLVIDHLCGVPACVNPDHLEAVTQAENCQRGKTAKITAADAAAIRASSGPPRFVAAQYGISSQQVYLIRKGSSWKAAA